MDQELKGAISIGTAITGASVSWLDTLNTVVSIGSGIAAFIASCFAVYYYIRKGRPER